jgi:hypothetical protein
MNRRFYILKARTALGKKVTWTLDSKHLAGDAFDIAGITAGGAAPYWFAPTYFGCTDSGSNTGWDFSAKKRIF